MQAGLKSLVAGALATAGVVGVMSALAFAPISASPAAARSLNVGVEAHAGGAAVNPAYSLEAVAAAIAAGADVIEIDVQYTADHVAVLNHEDKIADVTPADAVKDGVLPRPCDHAGALIHRMTYAQVQQIRCAGQPLPSLAQVIDLVKPSTARIDLEIKTFDDVTGGTTLVQSPASRRAYATSEVTQLLASGMKGRFLVSSFAWRDILPAVKAIDPGIFFLANEHWDNISQDKRASAYQAIRDARAKGADGFAMDIRIAQVSYLNFIKALGMYPMLFHNTSDAQNLFALASGVPWLSADNPAAARTLIDSLNGQLPTQTITTHTLKARTVLNQAVPAGATRHPRIIAGVGLVPTSAQRQLAGVQLQVTITGHGRGTVDLAPRNSRPGIDGTRLPIPNGTTTTTVYVSPGDHGDLRVLTSASARITVTVTGWTAANN
jgi:glycerophosphoryl diester phosphodiesterase